MSNKIYREEHGTWILMLGCKGLTLSLPQVTKTDRPRQNFSLQCQYNIKQVGDENREEYQSWDY